MIRLIDIILAIFGLIIVLPLLSVLIIFVFLDTGSPIYLQTRVGRQKKHFTLIKLRTMNIDTESVATHLVNSSAVTRLGYILRRTKLDELPQLWNVIRGDMSLVGPRPCLPSQFELVSERDRRGVFSVRPGITGLAQINRIDMSTPKLLAKVDAKMLSHLSVFTYFGYVLKTISGKGSGDRVSEGYK